MLLNSINSLGHYTSQLFYRFGSLAIFLYETMRSITRRSVDVKKTLAQMNFIGVKSLSVIVITGASVGSVLAWQTFIGLKRFGAYQYIGPVVFLGMVREFGPVLSAIMVAGRAGSAMTAEIGTMKISEQVDALRTLGIDVQQYLIIPRIIATTIVLPLLSLFCSLCGIIGGYIVAVWGLKVNHGLYLDSIRQSVEMGDIFHGLSKAVVFGFLIAAIATYKGFHTYGGAKSVGTSTTQSVVNASLAILVVDYIMTSLMSS